MVYRQNRRYINHKNTGFFVIDGFSYSDFMSGDTVKYHPIIGEIWDVMGEKYTPSKRSGARLELDFISNNITAWATSHGRCKDCTMIEFDKIERKMGKLIAYDNTDEAIWMQIIKATKGDKQLSIIFAQHTEYFFIVVSSDVGKALNELTMKQWDLTLDNCKYEPHVSRFNMFNN